jgi:hypothetical protein
MAKTAKRKPAKKQLTSKKLATKKRGSAKAKAVEHLKAASASLSVKGRFRFLEAASHEFNEIGEWQALAVRVLGELSQMLTKEASGRYSGNWRRIEELSDRLNVRPQSVRNQFPTLRSVEGGAWHIERGRWMGEYVYRLIIDVP